MKQTKPVFLAILLSAGVLSLGLLPQTVHGSAWTREEGGALILLPVSYIHVTEAFDDDGDRVDRRTFEMAEFSPLFEYGLTDSLTIGAQPKYRVVRVDTGTVADGMSTNQGIAESDFFVRKRLWSRDQASFAVQGLVKVPLKDDEGVAAALARDQVDAQIELAYGNRRAMGGGSIFYSAEAGYRKRWEDPNDEISVNAFLGWSPGDSWSFILRSANTWGVSDDSDGLEVLATGPSFTRNDAQLMVSYRFRNAMSLVGGVSTTYAGENVGAGNTAFLALTLPFGNKPTTPFPHPEAFAD
jgi:hypothetical protein